MQVYRYYTLYEWTYELLGEVMRPVFVINSFCTNTFVCHYT